MPPLHVRVQIGSACDVHRRRSGVGWVPANLALTPFGVIAADNPFGPLGDLRLIPDAKDEGVVLPGPDDLTPTRAFLCDVRNTDGSDWPGCGRTLLKSALSDLSEMFGLGITAAFERGGKLGVTVLSRHIPRCMLPGYEDHVADLREDKVLVITPRASFALWESRISPNTYTEKCAACRHYRGVCLGARNDYLERYGDEELTPALAAPPLEPATPAV